MSQQAADGSAQNAPPPAHSPQTAIHPAQSRPFTFKTSVTEVVIYATVIDHHDHLVTTLQKQDFAVYENDVPQTITSFSQEDVPVSMAILSTTPDPWRKKAHPSIAPPST